MKLLGFAVTAAACLLSACSGIVENHASPDKVKLSDFQNEGNGVVVLSTGADKECTVYSKFLYVKDATGGDVSGTPMMSMDVYAVKSDFTDHYGTVNAIALKAGKYFLNPRNANWQVVSKTNNLIPFDVVAGQTTYLGELYMRPSCGPESRLGVRDQFARDVRVLVNKNPAFAQRKVIKHLLLDPRDIGGEELARELVPAIPAKWSGALSCTARADAGPSAAAFSVPLEMEMQSGQAQLRRSTAEIAESFTGVLAGLELDLRGDGHRVGDPARAWQYRLKGNFVQDGPAVSRFAASGPMLVSGSAVRTCKLQMTPQHGP